MKKIKIVLAAITIVAAVGGALAFNTKSFGLAYCTKTFSAGTGTCDGSFTGKVDNTNGTTYYGFRNSSGATCTSSTCNTAITLTTQE